MTNISIYNAEKHNEMIMKWHAGWNISPPPFLPTTGLVIEDQAAIFWYETNSPLCLVDNFISNPLNNNADLDKLIEVMLHVVKEKGFKMMLGTTRFEHVLQRAEKHGFVTSERYVVFAKDLRS